MHRFLNAGHRESYTQSVIDGTRKRDILALSRKVKTLLFMLSARQSADRTRQKIRRDLAKFGRKTAREGKAAIKLKKKDICISLFSHIYCLCSRKKLAMSWDFIKGNLQEGYWSNYRSDSYLKILQVTQLNAGNTRSREM